MDKSVIQQEAIEGQIFVIRGKKVMIDRDLAKLYDVETRALNQAVTRNIDRFPDDFMFQLTKNEFNDWRSQIVIPNGDTMGLRTLPRVFTEQGVSMLSSVLRSKRAIHVNIEIMRAFTKLREVALTHSGLDAKMDELEKKLETHDKQFSVVFDAIKKLIEPPEKSNRKIGFK